MTNKAVIYARQVPVFAATDGGVRARTAEEGVFLLSDREVQIDGVRITGEWKLSEGERVWLYLGYGLDGSFQLNAEKAAESFRSTELFWLEWLGRNESGRVVDLGGYHEMVDRSALVLKLLHALML